MDVSLPWHSRPSTRTSAGGLLSACLLAAAGIVAPPAALAVEEPGLKAAITYNLLLFVEWPADTVAAGSGVLTLCVQPDDPMNPALRSLERRPIGSMQLQVRPPPATGMARACQVLFVGERSASGVDAPKPASGLLVVSDDVPQPPEAAAIVLRRTGTKIGFDLDLRAARAAGLQLSAKLSRLARQVRE